ncbi:Toxin coregulated pilus biosynthesis protein E [Cupriavidus campinensis]|uniref:Type II secretion system protein GspF domain-containing protein n=1 Tax=Cupriavidus campinensis TaxID=151783 RepID=A0ABY3EJ76_9BURK|nr:type II secretion system F family protein [Cupriavidus campinensis]TSP11002.1 hypothetical protein FGG12_19250 [Cupriavidus campinensis]CAG2138261.1 Toxin coregulated pilus biosynthesis protein E [Cupriavidus campinensis]
MILESIRRSIARAMFFYKRDEIYETLTRSMEQGGSARTPLLSVVFEGKGDRAAERNSLIAIAHYGVQNRLENGLTLSEAMRPVIPAEEAMMIDGGEVNGKLLEAIRSAQHSKQVSDQISDLVRAAMHQPIVAAVGFLATSVFLGFFIWPDFLQATPKKYWDGWAYACLDLQMKSAKYWPATTAVLLLAVLYRWSLPRWTGHVRKFVDHIPPWSAYRDARAASLFTGLGSLIESGLTIDQSFERISREASPYMRWHIEAMRLRYKEHPTKPLHALDTGLFSTSMLDLVAESASQRTFDATLQYVGRTAMSAIVKSVRRTAILGNGIFLTIIFLLFMWLTAAMAIGSTDAGERQSREAAGSTYSTR